MFKIKPQLFRGAGSGSDPELSAARALRGPGRQEEDCGPRVFRSDRASYLLGLFAEKVPKQSQALNLTARGRLPLKARRANFSPETNNLKVVPLGYP